MRQTKKQGNSLKINMLIGIKIQRNIIKSEPLLGPMPLWGSRTTILSEDFMTNKRIVQEHLNHIYMKITIKLSRESTYPYKIIDDMKKLINV